jgi:hypothetical protein
VLELRPRSSRDASFTPSFSIASPRVKKEIASGVQTFASRARPACVHAAAASVLVPLLPAPPPAPSPPAPSEKKLTASEARFTAAAREHVHEERDAGKGGGHACQCRRQAIRVRHPSARASLVPGHACTRHLASTRRLHPGHLMRSCASQSCMGLPLRARRTPRPRASSTGRQRAPPTELPGWSCCHTYAMTYVVCMSFFPQVQFDKD